MGEHLSHVQVGGRHGVHARLPHGPHAAKVGAHAPAAHAPAPWPCARGAQPALQLGNKCRSLCILEDGGALCILEQQHKIVMTKETSPLN